MGFILGERSTDDGEKGKRRKFIIGESPEKHKFILGETRQEKYDADDASSDSVPEGGYVNGVAVGSQTDSASDEPYYEAEGGITGGVAIGPVYVAGYRKKEAAGRTAASSANVTSDSAVKQTRDSGTEPEGGYVNGVAASGPRDSGMYEKAYDAEGGIQGGVAIGSPYFSGYKKAEAQRIFSSKAEVPVAPEKVYENGVLGGVDSTGRLWGVPIQTQIDDDTVYHADKDAQKIALITINKQTLDKLGIDSNLSWSRIVKNINEKYRSMPYEDTLNRAYELGMTGRMLSDVEKQEARAIEERINNDPDFYQTIGIPNNVTDTYEITELNRRRSRQEQLSELMTGLRMKENGLDAAVMGFANGFTLGGLEWVDSKTARTKDNGYYYTDLKSDVQTAKESQPDMYKAGDTVGKLTVSLTIMKIAGDILRSAGWLRNIKSDYLKDAIINQVQSTVVSTPVTIMEGISQGKSAAEIIRDVGRQEAIDFAFNIGFSDMDDLVETETISKKIIQDSPVSLSYASLTTFPMPQSPLNPSKKPEMLLKTALNGWIIVETVLRARGT